MLEKCTTGGSGYLKILKFWLCCMYIMNEINV